jgi:membrane protein implicated in regulation of membrane protease activity
MDWLFAAHVLWFLTGAVFLLAEMALPGFVLLFFALGAFAAALAAWAGLGLGGQFVVFLVVSLAGVGLLRRMFLRVFQGQVRGQDAAPADAPGDSAVGRPALVTKAISPGVPGEIKFRGSFWRAEADEPIGEGENVVIVGQTSHDTGAYTVRPAAGEK